MHPTIERPQNRGMLVVDYGSQYTLLITRRLREIGIYAEVVSSLTEAPPEDFTFDGIILSGGPDSVTSEHSRRLPDWAIDSDKPILGICYGMQLLVEALGGEIRSGNKREYGRSTLHLKKSQDHSWLTNLPEDQTVWMSHGDDVHGLEASWDILGTTDGDVIGLVGHKSRPIYGCQFHPEVQHSENGKELLKNFVVAVCKAPLNWQNQQRIEAIQKYLSNTVGTGKVLMAVSGGVDSTVAAALAVKTLGADNITAVFVDNGLLRKNEVAEVKDLFANIGISNLHVLDREDTFLGKLAGVSDPEKKRKIIGLTFIEEFEAFARDHKDEFTHLGQGTLYPDVIESAGHGAGSKVIKSHHNVGGLPEHLDLDLVEPFRFLFKDEVRQIGLDIGIPREFIFRHPFPGPGLSVRCLGELCKDKLDILREADHIYINALRAQGYYDQVWQAFAVLIPVKTVGVMGDNRTYQWTCALRAVTATDGMTAGVGDLPMSFLVKVSDEIVRKVDGINRVAYDITTKPPATIEWE